MSEKNSIMSIQNRSAAAIDVPDPYADERQCGKYLPVHYQAAFIQDEGGKQNAEDRICEAVDGDF